MKTKEEFRAYVGSLISDKEKAEYLKKQKRKKILMRTIIPFETILLIALGVFLVGLSIVNLVYMLVFGFGLIITSATIINIVGGFKWNTFKQNHINKMFQFLLEDYSYTYSQNSYVDKDKFKESHFASGYDNYGGEDLFSINIKKDDGTSSDVKFTMSDLHLTRQEQREVIHHGINGSTYTTIETRTVTVYSGAFGYVDFPFSFKCILELNNRAYLTKKIKLEDIQFNKDFATYTDNQVEALCILTPTMITKLKSLKASMGGIRLLLVDSHLYIGMSRNLFELNKGGKTLSDKTFDRIYDDVNCIIAIIDEIAKNNKVFKM